MKSLPPTWHNKQMKNPDELNKMRKTKILSQNAGHYFYIPDVRMGKGSLAEGLVMRL